MEYFGGPLKVKENSRKVFEGTAKYNALCSNFFEEPLKHSILV